MEIYVSTRAKVYILENDGFIRQPDVSEVEFAKNKNKGKKIKLTGPIEDQKIKKCRCAEDEIIIEKFENTLSISTAHKASEQLYYIILRLAEKWGCIPEIKKCENLKDLYTLDKIIHGYNKIIEK